MGTEPTHNLSRPGRTAWLTVNLLFGIVPTLVFFTWVEQDADSVALRRLFGWPWLTLGVGTAAAVAWNAALFAPFAALHTVLAQVGVQECLRALVPAPAMRSFYLAVSGTALFVMMGLWQPTGVTLWRLPVSPETEAVLALLCFAVPAVVILFQLARLGFWDFLGVAQLLRRRPPAGRTAGTPVLCTGGVYGWVRHPIYTCLLAMFVLGPTLSLDRLTLFLAAAAYLTVGIPVEERKLVRLFGPAYEVYRQRVPALVPLPPSWRFRRRTAAS